MVNPDEQPTTNGPMADHEPALIEAVVEETVAGGPFDLSAERVSARAGIATSAFYERFSDEQAAIQAAHEVLFDRFVDRLVQVCDAQPSWPLKVKVGIGLALDLAAASPVRARFLTLETLPMSQALVRQMLESRDRLARLLAAGRTETPRGAELPGVIEQALIAGIAGVVSAQLGAGEAEQLPALAPQLVELTLTPYLGRGEAAEVARRTRPRVEDG